jgi:hypothetical protein
VPGSVEIAAFVFAAILILVALLGGGFKAFGVEVRERVPTPLRVVAGVLGAVLGMAVLIGALYPTFQAILPLGPEAESTTSGGPPPKKPDVAALKDDLRAAAEDYYEAVDREDWSYTYENLAAQTKALFTEEEWLLKNQWAADAEESELSDIDIIIENFSRSALAADLTVYREFKDGDESSEQTHYIYEERSWKHRFSDEQKSFFMPEASFEDFVEAKRETSPGNPAEASAVENTIRNHYEAIGAGDFEEA